MSEIVVGLDIGTTKIACIVGRRTEHGKIEIVAMGKSESVGVTAGVVSNIEKTIQSIVAAVESAQNSANGGTLTVRVVNVGIAGQHISSLQHRGMLIRDNIEVEINQGDIDRLVDNMYKILMAPGEEIIHVLPQEYIVDADHGIKDPIGMAGIRLEANFHIITGHISAAKNIKKCVEKAGLILDEMMLEPLASSEAVLSDEEKEAGVVLVDIGGGTTDVAIFHDGIIRHTAVIPFGGNSISQDIREGCNIMKNEAEALKVKFGSALASECHANAVISIPSKRGRPEKEISQRNLASIIQARMEEIVEHVYFEIRNTGLEKKLIAGIVVTGGGAQLKNINQLFEYVTGMDTRIGYPNEHLATTNFENITSPMYSTAIGLVIAGFHSINRNPKPEEDATKTIKTHSTKTKGGFFEKIFEKSKSWFSEED